MSNAARKQRRSKRRKRGERERGPCIEKGCGANGSVGQECELCAKKGKQFKLLACRQHVHVARNQLKRHILLKHPGALPSWMAAALAGRDMR